MAQSQKATEAGSSLLTVPTVAHAPGASYVRKQKILEARIGTTLTQDFLDMVSCNSARP